MSSSGSEPSAAGRLERIDPVLRNALRYTISPREYELLHQYLLSRAPAVKKRTLPPKKYDAIAKGSDDYNAAAIRASLRLAVVTFSSLKAWDVVSSKLLARGKPQKYAQLCAMYTGAWLTVVEHPVDCLYGVPPTSD